MSAAWQTFVLWLLLTVALGCEPAHTSAPPPKPETVPAATVSQRAPDGEASAAPKQEGPWEAKELTWDFESSSIGRTRVVVTSPKTDERLPVLIAMHGLGEAQKGVERGARGWIDDYGLNTALERLKSPPLTNEDMQRLGTKAHLAKVNAQLAAEPYAGLIVVMPYTPDIIGTERSLDAAIPLGEFLVKTVLPRVYAETPAIGTPATTGVDGVSLGGRAALLVGFAHPEHFGVVGSMQAAIYPKDLRVLTERAKAAPSKLTLRLVTSSDDFYRPTIKRWSKMLGGAGVEHDFEVIDRGPHSYAFNRGLGVYAMLMFHDRALRGEALRAQAL